MQVTVNPVQPTLATAPAAAAESAANSSPAVISSPNNLLTPAVTRVIDWHQRRLSARHSRSSTPP